MRKKERISKCEYYFCGGAVRRGAARRKAGQLVNGGMNALPSLSQQSCLEL